MKMTLVTRVTEAGAVLSIPSIMAPAPCMGLFWILSGGVCPGCLGPLTCLSLSVRQFPHLFPKTLPSLP